MNLIESFTHHSCSFYDQDERKQYKEEAKATKAKLEVVLAERTKFESELMSTKEELDVMKSQLSSLSANKENNGPAEDDSEAQMLKSKNDALTKKLRKYHAHCEHLQNDCNILKEENKVISPLQDELEKVNAELERVNTEFEKLKAANSSLLTKNEDFDKECTNKGALLEKLESKLVALKQKYAKQQEINESLKRSSEELEYEKNRQISYLENENLQYLGELKTAKKEIQSLKVQRQNMNSALNDEPTEDLGSIISMNVDAYDKENHANATIRSSSTTKTNDVKRRGSTPRVGLGADSSHVADDDEPGECKQS